MIDMGSVVGNMFAPVGAFLGLVIKIIVCGGCALLFGALAYFFIRYHFNPLRLRVDDLRAPYIKNKWLDLFRWLLVDFLERDLHRGEFNKYGFTFYVGRQGAGKRLTSEWATVSAYSADIAQRDYDYRATAKVSSSV